MKSHPPPINRILCAADIAKIFGWQTQRARRWLKATGAGAKRGNRYVTTLAVLLAHFPEAAAAVLESGDDE